MDERVMATKKSVSLSVGRGEKLPVSKGAGLTAKGREKYNRETGSNLKAPAPNPKTKADEGRKKSFCARMGGVAAKAKDGERAKAALKRWKC
jgi:NAD/NADP transhydrogenase alpha subunit